MSFWSLQRSKYLKKIFETKFLFDNKSLKVLIRSRHNNNNISVWEAKQKKQQIHIQRITQ